MPQLDLANRAQRLRTSLGAIVGERHHRSSPVHHARTRRLIERTLLDAGFELRTQRVPGPFGVGTNVVGVKRGSASDTTWLVGAHYDTVPGTPGADDNGIAVAGLLELATALAHARPRDGIELVAWDMEEFQTPAAPGLLGSGVMAGGARIERKNLAGVFDLEMIGLCRHEPDAQRFPRGFALLFPSAAAAVRERENRGDFIAAIANPAAMHLVTALEREARAIGLPLVGLQVQGLAAAVRDFFRSDHAPFWEHGFPAVMLTDTAEFRSGHYHQPSDTIDTIDFAFAARVVTAVERTLLRLSGAEG